MAALGEPVDKEKLEWWIAHLNGEIQHENDLLNHRLTWLLTLEGLLFASFGLLIARQQEDFPVVVICIVGAAACGSIGYILRRGVKELRPLNDEARRVRGDLRRYHELEEIPVPGELEFLFPWIFLPWIFGAGWFALALYTIILALTGDFTRRRQWRRLSETGRLRPLNPTATEG